MKVKNALAGCLYLLTAVVVVINLVYNVRDNFSFDMTDLPAGKEIAQVASPDSGLVLTVYRVKNSLGKAVRVTVSETGSPKKTRNVYWQTDMDYADCEWISSYVAQINDVPIDVVNGGFYDSRLGVSILQEGSVEGVSASAHNVK